MKDITLAGWRRIALVLMGAGAVGFALHLLDSGWPQPKPLPARIGGFERIAMSEPGGEPLDAALYWKSAVASDPHPADQGQVWLSLTPADATPPLVWNLTRDELATVEPPPGPSGRIASLGRFHGGLAPASVDYDDGASPPSSEAKAPAKKKTMWGYVDTTGKWAIPPRYVDAGTFVGDIAVVAVAEQAFKLIDRQGKELAEVHGAPGYGPRAAGVGGIKLTRVGLWVWVDHQPPSSVTDDGVGEGEPTQLFDGAKLIPLPGVNPTPSIDGELWLVHTSAGRRLWRPASGVVNLPEGIAPLQPLNAKLFLSHSRASQSAALFATDGRLLADPAPIVKALTSTRFIACESGVSASLYDWREHGRNLGPDLPGHRCGILDDKGQWWAQPVHQMIDAWGEHEVRLQAGSNACIVDLAAAAAPDCATRTQAALPVPLLKFGEIPRRYGYQGADRQLALPYQYTVAYPFIGQVAEAADASGFPGLIDAAGRWLTPRPGGELLAEAQLRAAIVQSPYRNRAPTGAGLIARSGNWAIPPVFKHIARYADGSLLACQHELAFGANCSHLDTAGKPLPPITERTLDSLGALSGTPVPTQRLAAVVAATQDKAGGRPQPVAVAVNGRWGFQDDAGKWVVEPRFDDAEDFADELAPAGVWQAAQPAAGEAEQSAQKRVVEVDGKTKEMRWGLVDRSGRWVVEPRFDAIARFSGGVAVAQQNGLYGLIDGHGQWLAEPEYASIGEFDNDAAIAVTPSGSQCQLGRDGKCSGAPDVEIVARTDDAYTVARTTGSGGGSLFGYLGRNGSWAIQPVFSQASPFVGDFAVVHKALPDLPEALRRRWVTVEVRLLAPARIYAVRAERPGAIDAGAGRIALVDDAGRWLLPRQASWPSFLPDWSKKK